MAQKGSHQLLPAQNPAVSGLSQCRFVHQYRRSQNPFLIKDTVINTIYMQILKDIKISQIYIYVKIRQFIFAVNDSIQGYFSEHKK